LKPEAVSCNLLSLCVLAPVFCTPRKLAEVSREIIVASAQEGYVTEHISQEEEVYAAERLDKIRRQNRIKAELQAVLDEQ
ncbi:hypothetical protein ACJ576_004839, partial [Escherichia coli]